MSSLISGPLKTVTVVTNTWEQSCRFYGEAFGYDLLGQGELTPDQKKVFGEKLNRYALWGRGEGSVVRLLELNDSQARPIREGARAYDLGMAIIEGGTPDVEASYRRVLRSRFGAISSPQDFYAEGPEPLGQVFMRSVAFLGPAGEQVFVTEITKRKGGVSLLKERSVEGINVPGNIAFCLPSRKVIEEFWQPIMGIGPVNDVPLSDPNAPEIMGGPPGLSFDMLLMGFDTERIGMEFHVYGPYHPDFDYRLYPTSFTKTGLAAAGWPTNNLEAATATLKKAGCEIISTIGLPTRTQAEPHALFFRGPLSEIIELVDTNL